MGTHRIFLGLIEIAGICSGLEQGFRELGIDSRFVSFSKHIFNYSQEKNPLFRLQTLLMEKKNSSEKLSRILWIIISNLCMIPIFLWAILRFNVFVFIYNTTFFNTYDLPILKFLGKKVIFIFAGSDARPGYIDGPSVHQIPPPRTEEFVESARKKKEFINKIEKYSDYIINSPSIPYFFSKPYINYIIIGMPKKIVKFTERKMHSDLIKILHAPTHIYSKGTPKIRNIIESLKKKGIKIDYQEIIGKPNTVVIESIQRCDFVIDQCYSDIPLSSFGAEAGSFKKPSILAGYYSEFITKEVPSRYIPPSAYCLPDALESTIERMIHDKTMRKKLGQEAYDFIRTHWSPSTVAKRITMLLDGKIPADWWYDPKRSTYIYGAGVPRDIMRTITKDMIIKYGFKSLQISKNSHMEKAFKDFHKQK